MFQFFLQIIYIESIRTFQYRKLYMNTCYSSKSLGILTTSLVIIMSLTRVRVNLHYIFAWMSRNSLLETGVISEVYLGEVCSAFDLFEDWLYYDVYEDCLYYCSLYEDSLSLCWNILLLNIICCLCLWTIISYTAKINSVNFV